MKWDVDSLKRLARTGDFIPSLLLFLVNDSCCYYVLVYFFLFPLIRYIASVPVLRESLDCSLLSPDALLVVPDEVRFQFSVLVPLDVVVLLGLLVKKADRVVIA